MREPLEGRAERATTRPGFAVNLSDVRRATSEILELFSESKLFKEYTKHDISHVNSMVSIAEWLVTDSCYELLTDADCFFIVLSIFFHDMGLIVTDREYDRRDTTEYLQYASAFLFSGEAGQDYRAKVGNLTDEDREKFLYQEFVRAHHGARVRSWLDGDPRPELGYDDALVKIVSELLVRASTKVRADIGMLCESHLHDDLDDLVKYKVSNPYGLDPQETVNLQFAAIVLRTADLFNITESRAPSTRFRIIDPVDPVSQLEWTKQNAVTSVRPKVGVDVEGEASYEAFTDTIEVFAAFKDARGFFGLTSYLRYAAKQLRLSQDALEKGNKKSAKKYAFPWKNIDESEIEAEGFLKQQYGFEIDQAKILELLTGHTLYNDSSVVIRELVQNSIDASRLQQVISKKKGLKHAPKVRVSWDSSERQLSVSDNGTGMTWEVIVNHLLKVGSSRYQDPKFCEDYPDFSPISRFGIGVLSTFMVADEVEISTSSIEEDKIIQISLRSVHGKYLVKLLRKEEMSEITAGGTIVTLRLRPSVSNLNIEHILRKWITFPRCEVSAVVDGGKSIRIGFESPVEAVEYYLNSESFSGYVRSDLKAVKLEADGVELAIAIQYNRLFRDWQVVSIPERLDDPRLVARSPVSTSVEGIAVEFTTPGYATRSIVAIANATGKGAPKTNVARSGLEQTVEKLTLEEKIYRLYASWAASEAERLRTKEKYNLTWATEQLPFLIGGLTSNRVRASNPEALESSLANLNWYLLEDSEGRKAVSLDGIAQIGEFITEESALRRSFEYLVRESRRDVPTDGLAVALQGKTFGVEGKSLLVTVNGQRLEAIKKHFNVVEIICDQTDRSLQLRWAERGAEVRWLRQDDLTQDLSAFDRTAHRKWTTWRDNRRTRRTARSLSVPISGVTAERMGMATAVMSRFELMLLPSTPLVGFFEKFLQASRSGNTLECLIYMSVVNDFSMYYMSSKSDLVDTASSLIKTASERFGEDLRHADAFHAAIEKYEGWEVFDPFAWEDREGEVQ
ncbi:MAG: Chaperone protein HtpG [Caulobacter sp.]|nr:Chaperone protein HtpG [Caulobacter sp.]